MISLSMKPLKSSMLSCLQRGLVHLYSGTLSERLRMELRRSIKRKRYTWWESQIGKRQYVETEIQPNLRMQLYLDSRLAQGIYGGDFELKERQFLNALLRPGDVFVDVGANIGLFTLIAARCAGNTGRIYAFEPCAKTYQRLMANVELNRLINVSCHQLALSDSVDQLDMNISLDGYEAWNSLAQPTMGNSFGVETVNCTTWDDFAREHDLVGRVTVMKIDVEGWEARVLLGGSKTLSRIDAPTLQVEFSEEASRSAGTSCTKLYQLLEDLGYQMFIFDARLRRLVPAPPHESYQQNLIATKKPAEVLARLAH